MNRIQVHGEGYGIWWFDHGNSNSLYCGYHLIMSPDLTYNLISTLAVCKTGPSRMRVWLCMCWYVLVNSKYPVTLMTTPLFHGSCLRWVWPFITLRSVSLVGIHVSSRDVCFSSEIASSWEIWSCSGLWNLGTFQHEGNLSVSVSELNGGQCSLAPNVGWLKWILSKEK